MSRGSLRITTRHELLDEFLTSFSRWVDEESIFIITDEPRPLGMNLKFLVQLKDGRPVMRGTAVIVGAYTGHDGPGGKNGFKLRIVDMDVRSEEVFRQLVQRRHGFRPGTTVPPRAERRPLAELPDDVIETLIETGLSTPVPRPAPPPPKRPVEPPRFPLALTVAVAALLIGAAVLVIGLIKAASPDPDRVPEPT